MSYYRIYPTKNNTLFRYEGNLKSQNYNSGKNPIMELMDGKGESKLVLSFDFSDSLKSKLLNNSFKANLKLWDAGILYDYPTKLKNVSISSFAEDFIEGDGYSFTDTLAIQTPSNWNKRDSINSWSITYNLIESYHLNHSDEDLNFEITTRLTSLNIPSKINLEIKYQTHETDKEKIFRKFLFSRHTNTVFKPFIEFFIEDEILDDTYNFYANTENKIFLINQNKKDFNGNLECFFVDETNTETPLLVSNKKNGVYYATITTSPMTTKGLMDIVWKLNDVVLKIQKITVLPSENLEASDYSNLFFYTTCFSTNNILTIGDIIPFNVISEIRGVGKVFLKTYEYKVTTQDGFEMCPWTKCSIYDGKIFFNLNTEFYFPETNYEIFLRYKEDENVVSSNLTYKFKLKNNEKSFMNDLKVNPYYSRPQTFSK